MSGLRTGQSLAVAHCGRGTVLKVSNVLLCCRKTLREAAERLADKYEDAKYRQEAIMNRFTSLSI